MKKKFVTPAVALSIITLSMFLLTRKRGLGLQICAGRGIYNSNAVSADDCTEPTLKKNNPFVEKD